MNSKVIIFDLDDTLYKEINYLKSAFQSIAYSLFSIEDANRVYLEMVEWHYKKDNVFVNLIKKYDLHTEVSILINDYRLHFPYITLDADIKELLYYLKSSGHIIGLITDGYSITQRNKLRALGLDSFFDSIIISEEFGSAKPDKNNYAHFLQFGQADYFYIADNIKKDFIVPNQLDWCSVCLLDNGHNIHKQDFNQDAMYLPKYSIASLKELLPLINL